MLVQLLLYVYRLRRMGERLRPAQLAQEGLRGDVRLEAYARGWMGRRTLLAYLFEPGTNKDPLPRIEHARVLQVREALAITGVEAVPRGRKKVEHYRQTWICSPDPIAPDRWPAPPRPARASTGFDPEDDDAQDLPAT